MFATYLFVYQKQSNSYGLYSKRSAMHTVAQELLSPCYEYLKASQIPNGLPETVLFVCIVSILLQCKLPQFETNLPKTSLCCCSE